MGSLFLKSQMVTAREKNFVFCEIVGKDFFERNVSWKEIKRKKHTEDRSSSRQRFLEPGLPGLRTCYTQVGWRLIGLINARDSEDVSFQKQITVHGNWSCMLSTNPMQRTAGWKLKMSLIDAGDRRVMMICDCAPGRFYLLQLMSQNWDQRQTISKGDQDAIDWKQLYMGMAGVHQASLV